MRTMSSARCSSVGDCRVLAELEELVEEPEPPPPLMSPGGAGIPGCARGISVTTDVLGIWGAQALAVLSLIGIAELGFGAIEHGEG